MFYIISALFLYIGCTSESAREKAAVGNCLLLAWIDPATAQAAFNIVLGVAGIGIAILKDWPKIETGYKQMFRKVNKSSSNKTKDNEKNL